MSFCELLNHLNFSFKFASYDFGCRTIDENLSSIQGSIDHWVVRNPSLFTDFVGDGRILVVDYENTDGDSDLACHFLNDLRQLELTDFSFVFPCRETSGLIVHVTVCRDRFDSDSDNFGLIENDSGVVKGGLVEDRSTQLTDNVVRDSRFENVLDDIPRVVNRVVFGEVVGTAIS